MSKGVVTGASEKSLYAWRLAEFLQLGIAYSAAEVMAQLPYVDIQKARDLFLHGCPPDLIPRILI